MSASLGGSLFCSWTCPEQGSHTVVLDGSLFEKEQGGHTFALEPHGGATAGYPIPGIAHFRHGKVRPRHPLPHRDHVHHPFLVAAAEMEAVWQSSVRRLFQQIAFFQQGLGRRSSTPRYAEEGAASGFSMASAVHPHCLSFLSLNPPCYTRDLPAVRIEEALSPVLM